ncbi:MAG: iron-sulfur cluster assembly scaffold protein [Bryobacterales bacterium]|nr:iron-sulfur cluster assembly scaffold protein [Bryobacterales bacterium]
MLSEKLLDHFQNPRNVGQLPPPAQIVEVANPACGDTLRLSVQWDQDRVALVRYRTRGCTASIATASVLTEWMQGKTAAELRSVSAGVVEEAAGGLPPESKHAAVLAADAVKALLAQRK